MDSRREVLGNRNSSVPAPADARKNGAGFSLVEVVLALAIVSFALVGILSMFPLALDTAKDSKNETRVTLIAQNIFSDLRFSDATNAVVIYKRPASAAEFDAAHVYQAPLLNFPTRYVAYDQEGDAIGSVTENEFTNRANTPNAAYLASISTNLSPQAGLVRIDVTVISPPQAGSATTARKTNFFTTYLPSQ